MYAWDSASAADFSTDVLGKFMELKRSECVVLDFPSYICI